MESLQGLSTEDLLLLAHAHHLVDSYQQQDGWYILYAGTQVLEADREQVGVLLRALLAHWRRMISAAH